jgi:hypothetical protein
LTEDTGTLQEILQIARGQKSLLDRGDFEAVLALQGRRQRLLAGIQSLDGRAAGERAAVSEILAVDRTLRLLLASELTDIQRKIQKIASLKRLLHARRPARGRPPRHLSRRI